MATLNTKVKGIFINKYEGRKNIKIICTDGIDLMVWEDQVPSVATFLASITLMAPVSLPIKGYKGRLQLDDDECVAPITKAAEKFISSLTELKYNSKKKEVDPYAGSMELDDEAEFG
jgi:hypothetical protein